MHHSAMPAPTPAAIIPKTCHTPIAGIEATPDHDSTRAGRKTSTKPINSAA
jgi:hypothetical protein